jgi:chorismate dehydratase
LNAKLKISAVSYLNTLPFIYAIESYFTLPFELSLDYPSICANKMMNGLVDIALVPVVVIPNLIDCNVITSYCIGADGPVASVMLYSQVPLTQISSVYMDYQSLTSVNLVKVLSKKFWDITPQWLKAEDGYENKIEGNRAGVVIGDRALEMNGQFEYQYDLADEWKKYSGLPFAFACWVAQSHVEMQVVDSFNKAIGQGINEIDKTVARYTGNIDKRLACQYLTQNISYTLDEKKMDAMKLFLIDVSHDAKKRILS